MYNQNKAVMEKVQADHQNALAAAEEKLTRTRSELEEKISTLEDRLAKVTAELGAARKEIKSHAAEANRCVCMTTRVG